MKKALAVLTASMMIFGLTACGSNGGNSVQSSGGGSGSEQITLKVGTTTAPDGHYVKGLERFKELLEEYSEGTMVLEIFPNSQLGNERDMIEGVSMGTISMTLSSTGALKKVGFAIVIV